MNEDLINKLPSHAKKEFLKYALKLSEKQNKTKINNDFLTFVKHVWPEFIEGAHHKKIAEKFNLIAEGKLKRLIINMPPRTHEVRICILLTPCMDGWKKTRFKNYSINSHYRTRDPLWS
jgi:hypothetical protein